MAGISLADVGEIVHGTTLVTNAIIERKGAQLGLITTSGFRDILEMGTEQRYDIYDLFLGFPGTLRAARPPARGRRADRPRRPCRQAARPRGGAQGPAPFRDTGVEAVAVCFLNAYRNPSTSGSSGGSHPKEFPELAVSLSSDVVAELWEYQRCVTTCANAYVQPLMDRYLKRLELELSARGFRGALRLMHSAGGLVSPETARAFPIRLLESGPPAAASPPPCSARSPARRT